MVAQKRVKLVRGIEPVFESWPLRFPQVCLEPRVADQSARVVAHAAPAYVNIRAGSSSMPLKVARKRAPRAPSITR